MLDLSLTIVEPGFAIDTSAVRMKPVMPANFPSLPVIVPTVVWRCSS
jgi:hypothetical protein